MVSIFGLISCENTNGQAKKQQANRPKSKPAAEWKKTLTPNQYNIMVESGTEPPYKNAYYNNHEKGVYVSAATGDVLFTSDDKFDSGTGWPSFVKPVDPSKVEIVRDNSYGMSRNEVIEKSTGLHLGHVFDDGPANRGGKRYCMNSGALKFIKK
ncbi:peptide-methionine (R)-S-oxide reductase [Mucilaginibacter terrenus]|uniref:peptide-methionine (R)-S-oxide reductase n=2 Tax=Mucilaginibacter terrenus TaxID=2482727 RepID=A0A3E2NUD1_9SPHI|nr:peptide-methionine (R)-S-oxide reductase [Mucilaginibacter terrenus]